MFQRISSIKFPAPTGVKANMMPIIMGDEVSIPQYLKQYSPLIQQCSFQAGTTVYLTVDEDYVLKGSSQRLTGIHTDGTSSVGWGGGGWGGGSPSLNQIQGRPEKGIYMASTNGRCRLWNGLTWVVDEHGGMETEPDFPSEVTEPNVLYWLTDRTPHESLPQEKNGYRQFFRLVADEIGIWYAQHSTHNPLGVPPNAPISWRNKFE